ncbi:hypothetical protein Unana1_01474 [Umbelopsis nana]
MSLTHDFECRLFDSPYRSYYDDDDDNIGYTSYGYEPFPVLVMAKQQGFVFNEEVLVSPLRRRSGYETLASMSKTISSSGSDDVLSTGSSQDEIDSSAVEGGEGTRSRSTPIKVASMEQESEGVVEIKLRATECDIWPE